MTFSAVAALSLLLVGEREDPALESAARMQAPAAGRSDGVLQPGSPEVVDLRQPSARNPESSVERRTTDDQPDAVPEPVSVDSYDSTPFREPLDDSYFEGLYTGYSDEELAAEFSRVRRERQDTAEAAHAQLRKDGRFSLLERDEEGELIFDGFSDGHLYSTFVGRGGGDVILTVLPFGEFREIYELNDRMFWLQGRTRRGR
ncbi:MAG: hypothetical protein AAGB93_07445 [Planctomycetota bacterium]